MGKLRSQLLLPAATLALALQAAVVAIMMLGLPNLAKADPALAGSWSGGGTVSFADGNRERARCRITYVSTSATTASASGTCATASGSATQTATLRRVGPGQYAGNFFNPEFGVSGRIRVSVRGNSQSVTLLSQSGTASLSLSR